MGKKNKELKKFNIGDWVQVSHRTDVFTASGKREIETLHFSSPIIGQVVGACYRQTGTVHCEYPDTDNGWGTLYSYLSADKYIFLWKVVLGKMNTPMYALPEHIQKTDPKPEGLPGLDTGWDTAGRKELSELMKEEYAKNPDLFPRDSKGRFARRPNNEM